MNYNWKCVYKYIYWYVWGIARRESHFKKHVSYTVI